jgi:hypothetical protein
LRILGTSGYLVLRKSSTAKTKEREGKLVNGAQRESTVGWVCDMLVAQAEDLTSGLASIPEEQRSLRWVRVQALLKARDQIEWAVMQANLFLARSQGKVPETASPDFDTMFQEELL